MDWIGWDERKRRINIEKHGYDFAALDTAFFEKAIQMPARGGRRRAVGDFHGRQIAVIYQPLGTEGISVVSMRSASAKERSRR